MTLSLLSLTSADIWVSFYPVSLEVLSQGEVRHRVVLVSVGRGVNITHLWVKTCLHFLPWQILIYPFNPTSDQQSNSVILSWTTFNPIKCFLYLWCVFSFGNGFGRPQQSFLNGLLSHSENLSRWPSKGHPSGVMWAGRLTVIVLGRLTGSRDSNVKVCKRPAEILSYCLWSVLSHLDQQRASVLQAPSPQNDLPSIVEFNNSTSHTFHFVIGELLNSS